MGQCASQLPTLCPPVLQFGTSVGAKTLTLKQAVVVGVKHDDDVDAVSNVDVVSNQSINTH